MNKKLLRNALIMATMVLFVPMAAAQVTIGSTNPPRATLDVVATTDTPVGVIAPHATRAQLQAATHGAGQRGAIVFVYNVAGGGDRTQLVTTVGYYWFDGAIWQPFGGGAGATPTMNVVLVQGNAAPDMTNLTADRTFFVRHGGTTAPSAWTLPDNLTAADAGKEVVIVNRGTGGIPINLRLVNTSETFGTDVVAQTGTAGAVQGNRARAYIWLGEFWIELP